MVKYPVYQKISARASRGHRALPNVNLGPPVILETTRYKVELKNTISYGQVLISDIKIFPLGPSRGCRAL